MPKKKQDEAIVFTDVGIPRDGWIFDGIETPIPTFTIGEVTKIFFGKSPYWLRWREQNGQLQHEGYIIGGRDKGGSRVYLLSEVEQIAICLLNEHVIGMDECRFALFILKNIGEIYGYFGEDVSPQGKRWKERSANNHDLLYLEG